MAAKKKAKPEASAGQSGVPASADHEHKKKAPKSGKATGSRAARPKAASADAKSASGSGKQATKPKPRPKAPRPAAKSGSKSSADKYADPELRDRLKDEIMKGDKGGKSGQWSARKAQLLASEYKKAGGKYNNDEAHKTENQKHLDQWTDEDWKTSDDKPAAREGGTTRYLPAEAWGKLTPAQKKATNAKKQAGSRAGKQFVANTDEAKEARGGASDAKAPKKAATKSQGRKSAPKRAAKPSGDGDAEDKKKPRPKPKARKKKASG